jgi:hypothetical protein
VNDIKFDLSKCLKEWKNVDSVRVISKSIVKIEDNQPIKRVPSEHKQITENGDENNGQDCTKYVKGTRAQLLLDNYTRTKINSLMDTGDFDSVSYLLKVAVRRLAIEYELGSVKVTETKMETE